MSSKTNVLEPAVVESQVPVITGLEAQTRGEIDIQIATARRFPRSVTKAIQEAMSLATLNEEIAESCFYAKPQDGKTVEGPSARLAEIMASCWGHMRSEARIVEEADKHIVARGTSWDLERNVAVAFEVRRSILKRDKTRFSTDMVVTASNAANSIAYRNSVFRVIPKAFWWPIYLKAREVAVGTAETLASKRDKALGHFLRMGATSDRVFAALGVRGADDITLEHVGLLKGFASAIRDGEATVDETFPSIPKEPQRVATAATAPAQATTSPSAPPPASDVSAATTAVSPTVAPTPPTKSDDLVMPGIKVLGTAWVEDGNGGFAEITTNRGVFVTREQELFKVADTCEGADTPFVFTWRASKRTRKGGGSVDIKVLLKIALDESGAPQQGELMEGGDGHDPA